jgi:nitrogen-specific signal transduction histidine kinase
MGATPVMMLILLISPETALLKSLQAALPTTVSIAQVATVAEAKPYLAHSTSNSSPLTLILLHAENESTVFSDCHHLRQNTFASNVPLIVLLTRPQDRQAALAAGADDYLLLPLLAAEVNVRLGVYLRSRAMMEERERLHQQLLQTQRLSTVGRLTATLSHEINNPMQAIQGALMLALEELDSPEDLAAYLHLCLKETKRVVQLLSRMRQIYRPQTDVKERLDLNQLLQEAITLAGKELKWQKIKLQTDLDPNLPRLTAAANQLHLVFLNLLLNLSDVIRAAGGGKLYLRSYTLPKTVQIEFSTDVPVASFDSLMDASNFRSIPKELDPPFDLSFGQDIIAAQGGIIEFNQPGEQTIWRVQLPIDDH